MDLDATLTVNEDPRVYRPSEDSYLLLNAVAVSRGERFLEVGTGTGLIALHAARTVPTVATDVNADAVRLADRNARRNGVTVAFVRTDLMSALRGPFDVVAFNPPYLEGEPRDTLDRAWSGGKEGSAVTLRFLEDLSRVLSPHGRAYLLMRHTNASARDVAASRFLVKVVASKALFFERLDVLELRPKGRRAVTRGRLSRASQPSTPA